MKFISRTNNPGESLGVVERTAYGIGNFTNAFLYMAIVVYLMYYYTNVLHLNAGVIGTILLVSRTLDGFTDLIMGNIVDKTKSKKGKARVWIWRMCVPYAIGGLLLFTVPTGTTEFFQYFYIIVFYNLFNGILLTSIQVPYNVLAILMTSNTNERGLLGVFSMMLASIGGLVINATTLELVAFFGGTAFAWGLTIAVFAVIGCILHLVCYFGCKERVIDEVIKDPAESEKRVPFGVRVKSLVQNKYYLMYLFAIMLFFTQQTIYTSGTAYFAQIALGDINLQPMLANTSQMTILISLLFTFLFLKYLGKGNTFKLGAVLIIICFILQAIAPTNLLILTIGNVIKGISSALLCSCIVGIGGDVLDYGEWKSGVRVAGLGMAAVSFGQKMGTGIASAVIGFVLNAGGFDSTRAVQGASAHFAVNAIYIYIPLVVSVLMLLCMVGYDLDKNFKMVSKELNERRDGKEIAS